MSDGLMQGVDLAGDLVGKNGGIPVKYRNHYLDTFNSYKYISIYQDKSVEELHQYIVQNNISLNYDEILDEQDNITFDMIPQLLEEPDEYGCVYRYFDVVKNQDPIVQYLVARILDHFEIEFQNNTMDPFWGSLGYLYIGQNGKKITRKDIKDFFQILNNPFDDNDNYIAHYVMFGYYNKDTKCVEIGWES